MIASTPCSFQPARLVDGRGRGETLDPRLLARATRSGDGKAEMKAHDAGLELT